MQNCQLYEFNRTSALLAEMRNFGYSQEVACCDSKMFGSSLTSISKKVPNANISSFVAQKKQKKYSCFGLIQNVFFGIFFEREEKGVARKWPIFVCL